MFGSYSSTRILKLGLWSEAVELEMPELACIIMKCLKFLNNISMEVITIS
jgi:hypothetical protein